MWEAESQGGWRGVSKEESGKRSSPRGRQGLDHVGLCLRHEEPGLYSAWVGSLGGIYSMAVT